MSAINSNSSESDLEAIHRAQRAHEPSMEEILASIRNIIADDPAKGAAPKPQQTSAPMPQILYSKDDAAAYGDASGPSRRPEANAPTVVWRRPQAVEAEPGDADAVQRSEEPLLSAEADEAVALSFGALTANLDVRSAKLADSLGREEIQRVARGRK